MLRPHLESGGHGPETGFEEIIGNVLEPYFWRMSEISFQSLVL
jgi:hypothetical protein